MSDAPLRPMDEPTFVRMIRYALATEGDTIHLRPGCRPLLEGLGAPRELGWRQVTRDDTEAVAGYLLGGAYVSEQLQTASVDAAHALNLLYQLEGGEALVEARLEPVRGGLELHLDILRPLPNPADVATV